MANRWAVGNGNWSNVATWDGGVALPASGDTVYADGTQDVKEYPGLGHRIFDSELRQDLNGDGLVDRIRRNGSELKMHRLSELLVRKNDYLGNKDSSGTATKVVYIVPASRKTVPAVGALPATTVTSVNFLPTSVEEGWPF